MKINPKKELCDRIRIIEDMLPHDEKIYKEFQLKIREIYREMRKPENAKNNEFYSEMMLYLAEEYQWCYARKDLVICLKNLWHQLVFDDDVIMEYENILGEIEAEVNKPKNIKNEEIYTKMERYINERYKWCSYREELIDVVKTINFNFQFNEELRIDFEAELKGLDEEMSKPENKTNEDFYLEKLMGYSQVLEWYEI